jgi:hypothetical protein
VPVTAGKVDKDGLLPVLLGDAVEDVEGRQFIVGVHEDRGLVESVDEHGENERGQRTEDTQTDSII